MRLAEFEARIEDHKHFGAQDDWGAHRRWEEFSEVQKLDRIVRETGSLHLHFEPREYEIIDREVDLTRVPEGRRRGIESNRERLAIGPEEYERRRQERYVPPNEAAAAFRERIEEGLWKTCFTDGAAIFADWSDLSAEVKLHELARAMDWERVPESYFRTMVGRELKVEDLPAEKRAALGNPRDNRQLFSAGFEDGIDAPAPGLDGNAVRGAEMHDKIREDAERREARYRELFDTANRVQFAEFLKEKALDPDIAMRTAGKVREVYFQQAEATWDSFREEIQFRSDAEIQETLNLFKAKEAQLGNQEPKTLMDHLQAGGLFLAVDAPRPDRGDGPRDPSTTSASDRTQAVSADPPRSPSPCARPGPPRAVPETRPGQGHRTVTVPVTRAAIPAHRDFVKKWLTARRIPPIAECSKPMAAEACGRRHAACTRINDEDRPCPT